MQIKRASRLLFKRDDLITYALFLVFLCSIFNPGVTHGTGTVKQIKIIQTGWDIQDTTTLKKRLSQMEKQPFDGIVYEVIGRDDKGEEVDLRWAFNRDKWDRNWFQNGIDDIRACEFKKFTDNFILFNANPGNVDWFDDEGWKTIVEHWRIAAWVAKQTGAKGLLFDPEAYTDGYSQFHYTAQPEQPEHTFAEYSEKARQRGGEVMEAVAEEFPDITILCYFMNYIHSNRFNLPIGQWRLKRSHYGLYPAFIDGWLDALPPTITVVDGCEAAYQFNSRQQYKRAHDFIKGRAKDFITENNHEKYNNQVQVGFGFYLDAYVNPASSPWHIEIKNSSPLERFRENIASAVDYTDGYIWIYGEKFRWWENKNPDVQKKTWPEIFPGCDKILQSYTAGSKNKITSK